MAEEGREAIVYRKNLLFRQSFIGQMLRLLPSTEDSRCAKRNGTWIPPFPAHLFSFHSIKIRERYVRRQIDLLALEEKLDVSMEPAPFASYFAQ
jgi:hypothetical protein